MRILITSMAIALMTVSAHAQGMGRGHKHQQDTQKTGDKAKTKADERAYKEALKRIPVPTRSPTLGKACGRRPQGARCQSSIRRSTSPVVRQAGQRARMTVQSEQFCSDAA